MKALISLGATAHRGASLRQIRPGFRVSFDGDPAAGLGVFGGPGAGAGANPKEDWEDMEDWFLKDKREEEKKNTPKKKTQK